MTITKFNDIVPAIRIAGIKLGIAQVNELSIDISNDGCTPDAISSIYKQVSDTKIAFLYYSCIDDSQNNIFNITNFNDIVDILALYHNDVQALMTIFEKVCRSYNCELVDDFLKHTPVLFIRKLTDDADMVQILFEMANAIKGRYEYVHYTNKILHIAELIKQMKQLEPDGSIRRVNLKEIDMIFDKIKSNIEIA